MLSYTSSMQITEGSKIKFNLDSDNKVHTGIVFLVLGSEYAVKEGKYMHTVSAEYVLEVV